MQLERLAVVAFEEVCDQIRGRLLAELSRDVAKPNLAMRIAFAPPKRFFRRIKSGGVMVRASELVGGRCSCGEKGEGLGARVSCANVANQSFPLEFDMGPI